MLHLAKTKTFVDDRTNKTADVYSKYMQRMSYYPITCKLATNNPHCQFLI